jgi:hypothetical protein
MPERNEFDSLPWIKAKKQDRNGPCPSPCKHVLKHAAISGKYAYPNHFSGL